MTNTKQGQIQYFQGGGGGVKGGGTTSAKGASSLGVSGGMLPQKFLKICVSKIAISSILREISYSSNTNFLLVNFAFVKKKKKIQGRGGGGTGPSEPLPPPLLNPALPK